MTQEEIETMTGTEMPPVAPYNIAPVIGPVVKAATRILDSNELELYNEVR